MGRQTELPSVDPTVFDDPATTRTAAIQTFSVWLRQLPLAPENPSDLVRSVDVRMQHVGRLVSTIAEREVVWRKGPHGQTEPITRPKLTPDEVDPWTVSPQSLRSSSLYVIACDSCTGQGSLPCPTCHGTQSVSCANCGGSRKAYGYASNGSRRLMNCKQCGAKGTLPCTTCSNGRVSCSTCRSSGREERWLEVVETSRSDVRLALDDEPLRAYWAAEGPKASPAAIEADARRLGEVSSQGALSQEKAAELAPADWLQSNWQKLQLPLGPRERIQSQSLQVFALPVIHLTYALAGAPATTIRLEGRRMLVPPASSDPRFEERARKLRLTRGVLLALAIGVPFVYLLRGSYFWSTWVGGLTVCVAGSAAAAERFVRERTLGRENARRWGRLATVAALLAIVLAVGAEPSIGSVERHLSAGRLEAARKELIALGNPDTPAHSRAWIALRLAQALQGTEVSDVAQYARQIPEESAERAKANQHLYDLTQRTVQQHLDQKNPAAAAEVLAKAAPALQQGVSGTSLAGQLAELTAHVHEAEYEGCSTDACRWRTAFEASHAAPSTEREQRLAKARASLVGSLTPPPRPREPTRAWVQRLDDMAALAETVGVTPEDEDLSGRARQAAAWAQEEHRRIPLVGADREVAAGLLRISTGGDPNGLMRVSQSVALYCTMKGDHCAGVYLVGSHKGARVLNDSAHASATAELLSQALGHPSSLPNPPSQVGGKTPTMSTWKDGGVTIVARWRDTNLVELRIGDAKP